MSPNHYLLTFVKPNLGFEFLDWYEIIQRSR